MNMLKTLSALIIATIFASSAVIADGAKLKEKLSKNPIVFNVEIQSCNADAAILCPGLPLNSQKSFMCLMAYEDNLSTECKLGFLEAAMALELGVLAIEHSIEACEVDADKHCLNVKPGEGRIISCLKKNKSKLDKKCTAALKETGLWEISK
jgi:hypothetical protein